MPYAHNGDVDLYYETFGSASDPALLLVNGLGSQSISYKDEWCALFAAEGLFTIRFDNRDAGLSTKFDGRPGYKLADMALDALAVLDDLGIARAHVLGVSMGGMIVQQLAIDHPERLLSLTSVMSTTGDPDVGNPASDSFELLTSAPPEGREGYIQRQLAAARTWGSPEHYDEERISTTAGAAFDRCFCPDGQRRQFEAIATSPSRTEGLRSVTLPALVLHGDQDRLVDISGGRRTAEAIPGARFEVLEGMGHDYPPAFWPRIVELVAAHVRSAGTMQS